ncbi:MAG: undecaprenyl-diphosphate phosphatase [Betaproteobacteria bacterium]|jgi:undecaprenyl-diphosphatase|nr:MAG: undecaprenyl-diphosphate phosphatase [Betaproteobacteria bacterium]
MDLIKAYLLGLIEGLTEFIPVSSTGHLIVFSSLFDFTGDRAKVFTIAIQFGAILAVCWAQRQKLVAVTLGLFSDETSRRFVKNLLIAFMPAVVIGLLFHRAIKTYLFSPVTVASALIIGGLLILWIESRQRQPRIDDIDQLDWKDALKVGIAQTLAMFPGVSRSGATIMGAMVLGLSRQSATRFSFFLAIPTMFAATVYDVYRNWNLLARADLPLFAIGFIGAFLAALLTVRALLAYVARHSFRPFAWYRIAFGGLIILTWQMGWVEWTAL